MLGFCSSSQASIDSFHVEPDPYLVGPNLAYKAFVVSAGAASEAEEVCGSTNPTLVGSTGLVVPDGTTVAVDQTLVGHLR
jgi:hypothetical protein